MDANVNTTNIHSSSSSSNITGKGELGDDELDENVVEREGKGRLVAA